MAHDEKDPRPVTAPADRRPPGSAVLLVACASLWFISGAAAGQDRDNPEDVLRRVQQNVLSTIQRLPRYVCTLTVDRNRFEPSDPVYGTGGKPRLRSCDDVVARARRTSGSRRLVSADRLRLDVAVSHATPGFENEMYSWAGEDRFGNRDLFAFVREGAVSTGSFSAMLASIFGGSTARFYYYGDSISGGRLLSEFGFRIPLEKSQYLYVIGNDPNRQVPVAYDGTFLVDAEISDLVRLTIRTAQLPPETGVCELTQTLGYERVRLNGVDFLLPAEARASVIHTDGTEAENRTQYSGCREFHGESRILFDSSEGKYSLMSNKASDRGGTAAPLLPPGLPFRLAFTDPVDAATAAAGDLIRAKLKTDIRDRSSKVLVPKDTSVSARIVGIRRFYVSTQSRQPSLVLNVRLETLNIGGSAYPLQAAFDSGVRRARKGSGPFSPRVELGPLDSGQNSDTGTFEFWETNPDNVIKSGLELNWVTTTPH